MFLAPLNYDRYFKKVFSDTTIAKRFLEDFFEMEITEIELLKLDYKVTDEANVVKFDFRCKVNDQYIIIDMQQWYKKDIIQRFYLYHAANTVLQLEKVPMKKVTLDNGKNLKLFPEKQTKDYRRIAPVITLIWLVHDQLGVKDDLLIYKPQPSQFVDFYYDPLWNKNDFEGLIKKRTDIGEFLKNKSEELDFLPRNQLIFAFQRNIARNPTLRKYYKWFLFAEKTRNKDNEQNDFEGYSTDNVFEDMIRKLNTESLPPEEYEYIRYHNMFEEQKEEWREKAEEKGRKEGRQEGLKEGRQEGLKEGRQEGEEAKNLEVIKEGLEEGLSLTILSKLTKKTIQEIEEIIKRHNLQ